MLTAFQCLCFGRPVKVEGTFKSLSITTTGKSMRKSYEYKQLLLL